MLQLKALGDPVEVVTRRAREAVVSAIDEGWSGPPFDPAVLAQHVGLDICARADIRDARTVPLPDGSGRIEYNPTRSRGRVWYSIAHEIAHTFFPDWSDEIRERARHQDVSESDWELEALCNIAAAEILMPIGTLAADDLSDIGIDKFLEKRKRYAVSTEAFFIRVVRLLEIPVAMFVASRPDEKSRFRLDYVIGSRTWEGPKLRRVPTKSAITECTAIGFTAKRNEEWHGERLRVECVGIPPYPGSRWPRVAGIMMSDQPTEEAPSITYVVGDATEPRAQDSWILIHVANDGATSWSPRGFAGAVARRWPDAHASFTRWAEEDRTHHLALGQVHIFEVARTQIVATIIGQHGYGESRRPRIRYGALQAGLRKVSGLAVELGCGAHMPRIGCGQAGGSWEVVEEIVLSALCDAGVPATVYDDPNPRRRVARQTAFDFAARVNGT